MFVLQILRCSGRQDQKNQELRIFYKKAPLKNEISIEISQFFDYIRK